ncbi:HxsD-like protein [Candidatus Woesearchaeota archaeon]|nr:HxsD-like protein [Candidatus Woesearchaeota archaeon]
MKFKLNKKFYSEEIILQAIADFKDTCESNFDREKFEVVLVSKESCDLNKLKNEFCNYCLGLMK